MPRPKVRPEDRRRVVKACEQCRAAKKACEMPQIGGPCSPCVKRGYAASCSFQVNDVSTASDNFIQSDTLTADADANPGQMLNTQNIRNDRHEVSHGSTQLQAKMPIADTANENSLTSTTDDGAKNTTGDNLYVGRSAPQSFLQFIRETVSQVIGPTEFSDQAKRKNTFELGHYVDLGTYEDIMCDGSQQAFHIDNYYMATRGILHVVTDSELRQSLKHPPGQPPQRLATAIQLLAMAIGVQTEPKWDPGRKFVTAAMFHARHIAFQGSLENPSLDLTRTFLLFSFYMLATRKRNAAFMYLGIAARSAYALGLHKSESYRYLEIGDRELRKNTWKSLVCMDMIVSSILGRAPATSPRRDHDESIHGIDDEKQRPVSTALAETYRLALIIDEIREQMYGARSITVANAENLVQQLAEWMQGVSIAVRYRGRSLGITGHGETSLMGSLHIGSLYTFAIILITRPFLIASLSHKLGGSGETINAERTANDQAVASLADTCLRAATAMAESCNGVLDLEVDGPHTTDILPANMCLLEAWIFVSGLILGFRLFANHEIEQDIEQAFSSTRKVLSHFSSRSFLAAHYNDVLSSLDSAITRQRDLQRSRKRRRVESMLDGILDLRPASPVMSAPAHAGFDPQFSPVNATLIPPLQQGYDLDPQLLQQDTNNFLYGWDGFSLPLWESNEFEAPPQ